MFFRRQAFEPQTVKHEGETKALTFLDRLLVESEAFAKELGERLKDRVFFEIFPHLAEGFIVNIREQEGSKADLSQERLDTVFQGTLTLLYRLLFLLYAGVGGLSATATAADPLDGFVASLALFAPSRGWICGCIEKPCGRSTDASSTHASA